MSSIVRTIESIEHLHGDCRSQRSRHESYTTWLLRQREKALTGFRVIKTQADEEKR